MSDAELRQLAKDREYEEAWESDHVQSWLASLSAEDRAAVVAANCDKASVSHAGPAVKSREADERAQQRIDNLVAEKHEEHSPEDEFAFRFEEEARARGLDHIDPKLMAAAIKAFSSCTPREAGDVAEAKRSTAVKIVQLLAGSSSRELAFKAECLLIVEGEHPESMAEVGRRYVDPKTGKPMSRANVSKACRELERGLKLGVRKSLKNDTYVEACRARTQAHHDRRKGDATPRANTQTPCPTLSLLSRVRQLQSQPTTTSTQRLIA
jgi:hypothetical protein